MKRKKVMLDGKIQKLHMSIYKYLWSMTGRLTDQVSWDALWFDESLPKKSAEYLKYQHITQISTIALRTDGHTK